jgi:ABC-type polysaccharide/polyol phosphate export permease
MSRYAREFDSAHRLPRPVEELADLIEQRSVLRAFIERELKVRYKRSVLGVLWTMLHPLLLLVVLTLVFSRPFRSMTPAYPAFLIPALLLWNFFMQSVTRVSSEASAGVDLWRRVRVPRTAMLVTTVASGLLNLAIGVVVVTIVLAFFRPLQPWSLLTLPVTALLAAVFTLGVALLLAAAALYFPDVSDILTLVLPALMFATPVIYPRQATDPRIAAIIGWNPLTVFIESFRQPLYDGTVPTAAAFVAMALVAMATLLVGWLSFTFLSDHAQYRG